MRELIEADVEDYFVKRVEELGGVAEKTRAIGSRGYFDRIAIIPMWVQWQDMYERWHEEDTPRVIFAELKRPKGGVVSIHQTQRHERYRAMGAEVALLKTKADVDALLGKGG